ncbi:transcription antiterminator BglG [Brenneria alni]|uniref:Transcription antiterminator BglG n=1 Tax=Brenneria alni TaxID=71656 RepID=A0A421DK19_9GAMM|nr:PRD domain-containing protein [Brenneria alni]RLM19518.1 transcription antiterminator BglG [Brenneria alni]
MKIEKILNNNVAIVLDEKDHEKVVMGKGITFNKKAGEYLNESQIEKIFSLNQYELDDRLVALLAEVPLEYINISEQIIMLAKERLPGKIHNSVYVSLADHLNFAIQRHAEGIEIKNALLWEIKKLYRDYFQIGEEALSIIKDKLGVSLPEDEAGFIALHIVNAQLNENMHDTLQMTRTIQDILSMVKYHFDLEYNENSLSYHRFITHLKFFTQRMLEHSYIEDDDESMSFFVKEKYADSFQCTEKINKYIELHHQHTLTNQEKMFLSIHIEQVRMRGKDQSH